MNKPRFWSCRINAARSHGNIFEVTGTARNWMRQLGVPHDEIEAMTDRVISAESYTEALDVIREWFPVETDDDVGA